MWSSLGLLTGMVHACIFFILATVHIAAVDRADRNVDQLLDDLNGSFHRLRQSGIDAELLDVISGFQTLTGPR